MQFARVAGHIWRHTRRRHYSLKFTSMLSFCFLGTGSRTRYIESWERV